MNGELDPSEPRYDSLVLRHARHAPVAMQVQCRKPFDTHNVGMLRDMCTDELVKFLIEGDGRHAVKAVTIKRLTHSARLHDTNPLDCYVVDGVHADWQSLVVKFQSSASLVAASAAVPLTSGASHSKPSASFLHMAQSELKSRASGQGLPSGGECGGCDGRNQYEEFVATCEAITADDDSELAEQFQEALKLLEAQEEAEDFCSEVDVGEVAVVESDSEHGGSDTGQVQDDAEEEDAPPPPTGDTKQRPKRGAPVPGDPSTYGTMYFPIDDGELGDICWSYGRACVSAHCPNPVHNPPITFSRCRMSRVAGERPLGSQGVFLMSSYKTSTKDEHMALAASKVWTQEQRCVASVEDRGIDNALFWTCNLIHSGFSSFHVQFQVTRMSPRIAHLFRIVGMGSVSLRQARPLEVASTDPCLGAGR